MATRGKTSARMGEAAAALRRGEPVAALSAVEGLETPGALALRGVALAQLGEVDSAGRLLAEAATGLEAAGSLLDAARARAALAELALADRRLDAALPELARAEDELRSHGDDANAGWLRTVRARGLALAGHVDEAERLLEAPVAAAGGNPFQRCAAELARAEVASRRFAPTEAAEHFERAARHAERAGHELLAGEVRLRARALARPVARVIEGGERREVAAAELARYLAPEGSLVVVDGVRRRVHVPCSPVAHLTDRPVLFDLLALLAAAWPGSVAGAALIARVFEERHPDESHHVRLRVALGRLREALPDSVGVTATGGTWKLGTLGGWRVCLLEPLSPAAADVLLALLGDGAAWSAADLAAASAQGRRTVQRHLGRLQDEGVVTAEGRARARRYRMAEGAAGIATQMLLVGWADPR